MSGSPFPCCCKCWGCSTKPDSIELVANVISGDNCCNHPNGTYFVGAASNSVFDSNNLYDFGLRTNGFSVRTSAKPCTWAWVYKQVKSSTCNTGIGSLTDYGDTSGTTDYIAQCMRETDMTGGTFIVVLDQLRVGVRWATNYSTADPGRRVVVTVQRIYKSYYCKLFTAFTNPWTVAVADHYDSGQVTCGSLPTTINFTSRIKSGGGVNTTVVGDTYSWTGAFPYTLCPAIASVNVFYA